MKLEILQDRQRGFGWLADKIHPQHSLWILNEFRKLFRRQVLLDRISRKKIKRTDHQRYLGSRIIC